MGLLNAYVCAVQYCTVLSRTELEWSLGATTTMAFQLLVAPVPCAPRTFQLGYDREKRKVGIMNNTIGQSNKYLPAST